MTKSARIFLFATLGFCAIATHAPAQAQRAPGAMAFTVTMPEPASQIYHVVFRCEGITSPTVDFKLPVWSPGYYGIMDFARNVQEIKFEDGNGNNLKWERISVNDKVAPNDWRVTTGGASTVTATYDVLASSSFVASPYLDAAHGFIIGTGLFLYVKDQINHAVTVEIDPYADWKMVATGLDPVSPDKPHTYKAPNFDVLYDSPILIGNLDSLPPFEVDGVKHEFVGYNMHPERFDGAKFMDEMKAVVKTATDMMGEVPYEHYVFLGYGAGGGGVEHLNSCAVPFSAMTSYTLPGQTRIRELNFLAHEYFHNFNVKRIRPIALGPFDYDRENHTHMLWVSEGFTVYYEYMLVARAGLMTQDELLGCFTREMNTVENATGHLYQSPIQASWDTWSSYGPGGRGGARGGARGAAAGNGAAGRGGAAAGTGRGRGQGAGGGAADGATTATQRRGGRGAAGAGAGARGRGRGFGTPGGVTKTISYYNTGPLLGIVLDFKIRHETKNQKSLDDVMRNLYQKYYKGLQRGFTDEEFQKECESVAGVPLTEFFTYANTTKEIDYPKYLAYAGLQLSPPVESPAPFLGAIDERVDGKDVITAVMEKSPAEKSGLKVGDEVKTLNGGVASAETLFQMSGTKHPGDQIKVGIVRGGKDQEIDVTLAHKMNEDYKMTPIANPDPLQSAILKSWQGNTAKTGQ